MGEFTLQYTNVNPSYITRIELILQTFSLSICSAYTLETKFTSLPSLLSFTSVCDTTSKRFTYMTSF